MFHILWILSSYIFTEVIPMINKIWCFFIILSILFATFTGNIDNLNNSIFSSITDTTTLVIGLFGSMCFWCGMMKIVSETTLQEKLKKLIRPLNKLIFHNLDEKNDAYEHICTNLVTNMLRNWKRCNTKRSKSGGKTREKQSSQTRFIRTFYSFHRH